MKRTGKRLLALVLVVAVLLTLVPAQALAAGTGQQADRQGDDPADRGAFTDVQEGDWFHDAVGYVFSHDIFQGTSGSTFAPYGTMTRSMMVTVLGRVDQVDPEDYTGTPQFTDVDADSWYAPYVRWAVEAGITMGVGGGRFAPDEPVTRAQMATFLWRYFQYIGAQLPETVTDTMPADYDAIPDYARQAAAALWRCGVFQGSGDDRFDPDRQLTRAEAAELLMRIDTHLVDIGAKEYPEEPDPDPSPSSPGYVPGGGSDDPDEDLYYEPDASDDQTIAAAQDVDPGFSITVDSSDSSLTADAVAGMITATDLSTVYGNGDAVTGCIQVSGSGGTYTITGIHSAYDEHGTPVEGAGFAPGHSYKIVLDDDCLTFAGQADSVREYDFTVARQEEMDLELADGMVYIPAGEIDDIVVNGQRVDELDVALVSVGEDGIVQDAGEDTEGQFTYTGGQELHEGDMVAVYEGTHPDERGTEDSAEDSGAISYVKITEADGDTYSFEGAEMEEVVASPDMFPLPDTYLERAEGNSIEVPASAFVYSGDLYTEMGLDSGAAVDVGDYIAFYSGYLDPAADKGEDFSAEPAQRYAVIRGISENIDQRTGEKWYTVTYEEVELQEILGSMNSYVENDVDVGSLMTEQEIADLEDSLEQQAQESGFAQDAAEEIARMALQTNSLEQVRDELGLSSLTVSGTGGAAASDTAELLSMARSGSGLLAAPGAGGTTVEIKVNVTGIRADVSTALEHFSGMDGLRIELTIPFTLSIQQSGGWSLEIEFDPTFVQELRIGVSASVDVIWDNWGYIIWWIDEFEVTANVDVYTFTDIDIDVNVTTDDGQADTPEQIEALTNFVDEIKSFLDGGGGDEEDAETLAERYQEMLQNDSEWVDLFSKRILHVKQNLAKIITIYIDFEFVVSGNVNVYIGMDFTYELGRRYIFTIRVFDGTATSNTVSLVPEQYTLDVYVMGKLGLRAGLRVTIGVALIHKAVASVELTAEIGPYIELYGFFYYQLRHLEGEGTISQAAGAMYVEVGLYAEMSANLSAIGGLLSWSPEIFSVTLPLWSAGDRYPVVRAADQTYSAIEFEFGNPAGLPSQQPRLVTMDLKTGEETTRSYSWDEFEITTTNDAVYYDETYHVLWAQQPYTDLDLIEEGQVVITWTGSNGCLAFNTVPIRYTIDFRWDKLLPGGYQIFLITDTDPSWIEYKMDYGAQIDYNAPTICNGVDEDQVPADFSLTEILNSRQGYRFTGWKDASGVFYPATADDPAAGLPATMPASDDRATYYYAQWEKVPIEYTVERYYEAGSQADIPEGAETRQVGDRTYYLKETTTHTAMLGDYITGGTYTPQEGYCAKHYYQESGVMSRSGTVLECYYDRDAYTAAFTLMDEEGSRIGEYTFDFVWGAEIKALEITPPAGYTFSGWTDVDAIMPRHDVTYTGTVTADTDTPFTVEHYVQQTDGTYTLQETTTGTGTTDRAVGQYMSGLLLDVEHTTATYDRSVTINGDGSAVVKVRYTLNNLYTATFMDNGRIVGRDYFTAGDSAVTPPELEVPEGQTIQWYYVDENDERVYGIPDLMPAHDMDFHAYLLDGEQVTYKVEHYLENADGTYPDKPAHTDSKTGVAGGLVEVTRPEELSTAEYGEGAYTATTISPDGTTVVRVEYPRQTYDITYHLNNENASFIGITPDADGTYTVEDVLFGAAVDLLGSAAVSCQEYMLENWSTTEDGTGTNYTGQLTMPAQDVDLYAKWTDGYVITVNHYQVDADDETQSELVDTDLITVEKNTVENYTPDRENYAHFTAPNAEVVSFQPGTDEYTVNYYYTPVVYTLEINYTSGEYDEDTDKVEEKEEKITTTAKYGQTLANVFNGMNIDGDSLRFGYHLSGFHETQNISVTHTTMPAPAEGEDTVTLTAEWEGDTFTIWFDYDGRMDLYDVLYASDPDRVSLGENLGHTHELNITLTYGEPFILPGVDGLRGIGDIVYFNMISEAGEDLCTPAVYSNGTGGFALIWDTVVDDDTDATVIYSDSQMDKMETNHVYRLGADLDYSRYTMSNHYTYGNKIAGTYHLDGAGHTISNLKINTSGYDTVGLFNALQGGSTITDLTLDGITVTSSDSGPKTIGILAGQVSGDVTITNVTVTNSSIGITGTMDGTSYYVGGLVGQVAEDATLTLTDCTVNDITFVGLETAMEAVNVGGLVGRVDDGAELTLTGCTVSEITDVSGAHAGNFYAGGFVGYGEISSNSDNNTNNTNWPGIGGPASGDGETVEGGENTGTATDDPNSTEGVGYNGPAGGEPTAPAVPGAGAPSASEEDGPGAIQAQSKAALTQVPVVKYGQRRKLARRG